LLAAADVGDGDAVMVVMKLCGAGVVVELKSENVESEVSSDSVKDLVTGSVKAVAVNVCHD
jgi:hypothetical protein